MDDTIEVSVDQVARAAGYLMMPAQVEAGARETILGMYPNDEAKGREQLRMGVRMGTGGINLSDDELTQYIRGNSIRHILAARLCLSGDIKKHYVAPSAGEEVEAAKEIAIIEGRASHEEPQPEIDRIMGEMQDGA